MDVYDYFDDCCDYGSVSKSELFAFIDELLYEFREKYYCGVISDESYEIIDEFIQNLLNMVIDYE